MASAMVHRGPDDEGIYVDPDSGLSLGVRRLSIIDVAGGHQPVCNEDGSVWAVLNGEIYNHPQLRKRLRGHGHVFASNTDTEVLVHLYEEYGESLVHAIEGMYAFAIWDSNKRRLTLVRDRFGEKPLFYCEQGGRMLFASELTAVRAGLGTTPPIDADALGAYFVLGYFPGEGTIFRGVRQLPPATILSWSSSPRAAKLHPYWSMPCFSPMRKDGISELAEEGAELLRKSVRSRLIADVPVGVFLSGGLDSALIATIAADEITGQLKTFTVDYDAGEVGEAEHARVAARHLGSDHHEVVLPCDEVEERTVRVAASLDQPNADPALMALHAVAESARPLVTVAIGGEGADELFGGYPRYRWIARAALAKRCLPASLARRGADLLRRAPNDRVSRLADVIAPMSITEQNLDWMTAGRRHMLQHLFGPRMRECAGGDAAFADVAALLSADGRDSTVARLMALDQRRYLPDDVLAKADRATMLASLEMRAPYLSRELAEFSTTIPPSVHVASGGKSVLREIANTLPNMVSAHRAKRAFRVPMAEWLREPLRAVLEDQVSEGRLVADGWIHHRVLRVAVDEHTSGVRDHAALLWPVLIAGLWFDQLFGA